MRSDMPHRFLPPPPDPSIVTCVGGFTNTEIPFRTKNKTKIQGSDP
jgi:hypothetical protein